MHTTRDGRDGRDGGVNMGCLMKPKVTSRVRRHSTNRARDEVEWD